MNDHNHNNRKRYRRPRKQQQNLTAIITDKKGMILSIGKNSYVKSHPWQAKIAKTVGKPDAIFLHAEIDAIIKCSNISKAHTISIFRTSRANQYVMAKPCKICDAAIRRHTWIRWINYTDDSGAIVTEEI